MKTIDEMKKKGWDRVAETYARDRQAGSIHHKYYNDPAILSLIGGVKGKKVLDAGCGEGLLARKLAKEGAIVAGVDLSEKLIKLAKKEEDKDRLGISYYHSSLAQMPYLKDEEFNFVVSSLVLHDLETLDSVLDEIHRVLKNGGELFVSLVHPMTKKDEDYFKRGWREFDWGGEYPILASYHRTASDYINSFVKAGFRIQEMQEPRPVEEGLKYEELKMWSDHPLYLLFKLSK